jgi:hypothetical protein
VHAFNSHASRKRRLLVGAKRNGRLLGRVAAGSLLGGELAAMQMPVVAFVTGLVESSQQLQAKGRKLTRADITPALVGRVAELFWPADNLWYLVKVQKVDMASMTADLYYQTGEIETLSLLEAADEGSLSLIIMDA